MTMNSYRENEALRDIHVKYFTS